MANIKDIAKLAGVSVATVSRVLNNHPYISIEKKTAVLQAIKMTDYKKNINAVNLRTGHTFLIGVVLPFSNHPYFILLLNGIANEAMKNNYKLVLFQSNYEEEKEKEALNMLKEKQIDALIFCSRTCDWSVINEYIPHGKIVLCENVRDINVSSTFVDHYMAFMCALEYLYQKGYRKIGYCIGRRTGTNSLDRSAAYKDFTTKHNLLFNSDYIFDHCLTFEDSLNVINKIKESNNPPSALLVTNDQTAAGIVTCCQNENISIPEDLALIGFDNQPIAKLMKITTIDIPLEEIGRKVFLQAINDEVFQEEMSTTLIERKTV
ncbi:LacI family DNA-binding transcriptional regulator [Bacillus sp. EB600]|uniref:LacI family DNA-binding transcriptional regulator n=1 Tax=Bacillus sp. EB600 TaxID=2806345 RepID=UPI00210CAA83|nr:LacI family DNA-binding transcriptional regulator [Bacillus sp. EB600]MCQ6282673.1 LacI family DNA-binding transcriptional regulator [Bacillus sp. EB600]